MQENNKVEIANISCETSIETFADNIISVASEITPDLEYQISKTDRDNIIKWLKTGVIADDNLKKKLDLFFDPQANDGTALTIPIWWSGFHTEMEGDNAPIHDMNRAAIDINGFSTMSINLAKDSIFKAQAAFWTNCTKEKHYQTEVDNSIPNLWGAAYSKQYTSRALLRNPTNLVYFFNKSNPEDVINTFFYNNEFPLILRYAAIKFRETGKKVNFYIFDTQAEKTGHCEKVKGHLEAKINEEDKLQNTLEFHCITGNSLTDCAAKFNEIQTAANAVDTSSGGRFKHHITDYIIKQRTKEKSKQRSRKRHIKKNRQTKRKSHKNKPRKKNKFYKTYKIR